MKLEKLIKPVHLTVYRIDDGIRGLENTNAGNLVGVLSQLDFSMDHQIEIGDYLSVFEVVVKHEFGNYLEMTRGKPRMPDTKEQACVGRLIKKEMVCYSFPDKNGFWDAKRVNLILMDDILDYFKKKKFDLCTTTLQEQAVALRKYLEEVYLSWGKIPYGCSKSF